MFCAIVFLSAEFDCEAGWGAGWRRFRPLWVEDWRGSPEGSLLDPPIGDPLCIKHYLYQNIECNGLAQRWRENERKWGKWGGAGDAGEAG